MVKLQFCLLLRLSRVSGDAPLSSHWRGFNSRSVPRKRGCSDQYEKGLGCLHVCPAQAGMPQKFIIVCPTYVGMSLRQKVTVTETGHLSRICGDVPLPFFK